MRVKSRTAAQTDGVSPPAFRTSFPKGRADHPLTGRSRRRPLAPRPRRRIREPGGAEELLVLGPLPGPRRAPGRAGGGAVPAAGARGGGAGRSAGPGRGSAPRGIGAARRDATSGGGSPASLGSLPARRPARRAGGAVPARTERRGVAQPGTARRSSAQPREQPGSAPRSARPGGRRSRQHRGGTARGCGRAKNKSPLRGHASGFRSAAGKGPGPGKLGSPPPPRTLRGVRIEPPEAFPHAAGSAREPVAPRPPAVPPGLPGPRSARRRGPLRRTLALPFARQVAGPAEKDAFLPVGILAAVCRLRPGSR